MVAMKRSAFRCIGVLTLLFLLLSSIPILGVQNPRASNIESNVGMIGRVRGGIGVVTIIDNFQAGDPGSNKSVDWHIYINGDFVLFGEAHGTALPRAQIVARTSLLPPPFGFGEIHISIIVTEHDSSTILTREDRTGFIIGFLIVNVQ